MEWYVYPAVIGIGFITGFINTLSGGGSALSLPMLIFTGLPANVANGTNRIGILMQSLVSTAQFKKDKILDVKDSMWQVIPALAGSIPGAIFAVSINEEMMKKVVGVVLIIMLIITIFKPEIWVKEHAGLVKKKSSWINILTFFLIGAYGGFIQVGVGFFLLSGLVLVNGMNLLKSNGIKNLIVFLYTPLALLVFIFTKEVNYLLGFVLSTGSMGGAWLAAKTAVKWGPGFVRYVLLIGLTVSAAKLFGLF